MDPEIEARARRRLELEDVRQRRLALELELEARRKAALEAQQKLAILSGETVGPVLPAGEAGPVAGAKQEEEDFEPDPSQSHAIINERLAQRRQDHEAQHQANQLRLKELMARRWELQEQQQQLQKMKETVVSEAAREAADAEAAAREMQAAMNIPPVEKAEKAASGTADDKDEKHTEEEEKKKRGIVRMHVLAPASLSQKVGEAVPRQEMLIKDLQRKRDATEAQAHKRMAEVPALNASMKPEDVVTNDSVAAHQRRWEEEGEYLNRQLRKEAFEKAIRKQMNKFVDEVIQMVVADVSAECLFSRFWAEQTAGSFIVQALLSQGGGPQEPRAQPQMTSKQTREKTNALVHILADYRRQRLSKSAMHVHSLPPVHPDQVQLVHVKPEAGSKDGAGGSSETSEVLAADKLLLYMDMPNAPPEDKMATIHAREQAHWRFVEAVPIFLTGLQGGVEIARPSPDSNQLALSLVKSGGVTVYDIRHLPMKPSRKRAGWGAKVVDMAWSADSTNLVTLDHQSQVAVWSVRADAEQKDGIVAKSGDHTFLRLVQSFIFPPLFNMSVKPPVLEAKELARLVDTRYPQNYLGSSVSFHPCMTLGGRQPSVMLGLKGGMVVKMNSQFTDRAVFAKCCVEPETADVAEGGGGGPVAPGSGTPLREYFVQHQKEIVLLATVLSGIELVTLDRSGLVCLWVYEQKAFSSMGWFTPARAIEVVVADAVFQDDAEHEPHTAFPNWFKGQGPDPETDRLAFAQLAGEYVKRIEDEHQIDPSKPFEEAKWEETTFAGRRKVGRKTMHKGNDIDTVSGRCYFHTLKYNDQNVLLSHVIRIRSRQIGRGFVLRARVDYSNRRLVLLCYLPPGGPRRHSHLASIFRVDLRDPISLLGPRIDMPLPDSMCKAIDKVKKKTFADEKQRQEAMQEALEGVDFDVAPPQGTTGVHVAHLLLGNKVYTFSLESGEQLMEPLDPLLAQKRRGKLTSVRCVAKFHLYAGNTTDPFAPPTQHKDPDTPASYEHLLICTTRDAPTVYMYSFDRPGAWQLQGAGQGGGMAQSPESSAPSSKGHLDNEISQVVQAHQRSAAAARAATRAAAASAMQGAGAGGGSGRG